MLTDMAILTRIEEKLKTVRLKQNITQQSLAEAAIVSLSTVKKIEKGEIRSFDAFLRILRTLGQLDVLQQLVEEEQLSPSEYYTWCRHRRPISVNALLVSLKLKSRRSRHGRRSNVMSGDCPLVSSRNK